ncbi:hypothetical protein LY90DRAFT_260930 [Neocallimastix californiae]|uniref:Uncharacterized protein n=1 Tax=Neocallimastix californiae TaxID=1754190 RepID=A0A1Y2DAP7_9FUNG|nr:hypothetical protein LY90DRAFT_260930 [Neocallimastix californiae]|eukprot:ORY56267.1 hypothetical protein LY90DRAFT_260930 [Neocallimastix californiae]
MTTTDLSNKVVQIKAVLKKIETNVSEVTYEEVITTLNQIYYIVISKKDNEIKDIFSSLSFNTIILFLQYEEIEDKIIKFWKHISNLFQSRLLSINMRTLLTLV